MDIPNGSIFYGCSEWKWNYEMNDNNKLPTNDNYALQWQSFCANDHENVFMSKWWPANENYFCK